LGTPPSPLTGTAELADAAGSALAASSLVGLAGGAAEALGGAATALETTGVELPLTAAPEPALWERPQPTAVNRSASAGAPNRTERWTTPSVIGGGIMPAWTGLVLE
jgi:hypothetical protein